MQTMTYPELRQTCRLTWIYLRLGVIQDSRPFGPLERERGLSIGSTLCKLLVNIILERIIKPWYEAQFSEEQNGFRKKQRRYGRALRTTDGIYSVKRVHQLSNRKKQPLYLLFIDLTVAFNQVSRKWLFDSI